MPPPDEAVPLEMERVRVEVTSSSAVRNRFGDPGERFSWSVPEATRRTVTDKDLFDDLDVPDPLSDLERASQELTVRTDVRRYGKKMVVIEGFEGDTDLGSLATDLKSALGTGGTVKEGRIELQGDHAGRVRELLTEHGFAVRE